MELNAKILDGRIIFNSSNLAKNELYELNNQEVVVTIKKKTKKRTNQQNASLHLYFKQLSEKFNESGLSVKETLKSNFDIPWSPLLVKELLWRETQKIMLNKKSTKQLNTNDIDKIYDVINKAIGEKFGFSVPFPNIELLIQNEERI